MTMSGCNSFVQSNLPKLTTKTNVSSLDEVLYAVNGPSENIKVQGFTVNPTSGEMLATWSPHNKVRMP